jgi:shikimate dehydrogenase
MRKEYKFALLGTPVDHSLSPEIHGIFADGCGIDIIYVKINTDKAQLQERIEFLKRGDFSGFNCTMPLKEEIIKYVDKQNEESGFLGVCNTVKIDYGKLNAFTTDGDGMIAGIKYNGIEVSDKNILVFGAGGSARAVILSLIKNNTHRITVFNRSAGNLEDTRALFKNYDNISFDLLTLENIERVLPEQDILINMSRLGMSGFEESPEFDAEYKFLELMKPGAAVADAVYKPLQTKLLTVAYANNLKVIDGFWMLVYQGALSFEIWTGLKVPEASIEKAHGVVKRC